MKTPEDVRTRAQTTYRRNIGSWLAGEFSPLVVALGPPTIRDAEADNGDAAERWLGQWARWPDPGSIEYTTKRLGYLGRHDLPARITLQSPEEVARAAGKLKEWRKIKARLDGLAAALGEDVRAPLLGQLQRWRDWDEATAQRFVAVVNWLNTHDPHEYYAREIPVIGVDTKWLGAHRSVVQAVTGELSFRTAPAMVELRSLDAEVLIRGARRISLEVSDAVAADPTFTHVLIVENHTTFLALPELPGTLAVWGAGYRADELVAALEWLAQKTVFYWGDLDSHGFRILERVRGRLPHVHSVLMDSDTARMHLDLAVEEPTATSFTPQRLTADEETALQLLRERSGTGCLRIEQERIVFDHVVAALQASVATV